VYTRSFPVSCPIVLLTFYESSYLLFWCPSLLPFYSLDPCFSTIIFSTCVWAAGGDLARSALHLFYIVIAHGNVAYRVTLCIRRLTKLLYTQTNTYSHIFSPVFHSTTWRSVLRERLSSNKIGMCMGRFSCINLYFLETENGWFELLEAIHVSFI
jgi:hypothetical protein